MTTCPFKIIWEWDFPGGPAAKIPCSQCKRPQDSITGQGTRSHMLQLKSSNGASKSLHAATKDSTGRCRDPRSRLRFHTPSQRSKIPPATTKTQHSQIHKYFVKSDLLAQGLPEDPPEWVSEVTQLCPTLCDPMDYPWNSPGQNTGVGNLSLLQGIFPT